MCLSAPGCHYLHVAPLFFNKSSAEPIHSVINKEDQAPHGVFNPFQHWSSFSKQSGSQPPKLKRSFESPAWDYCPGSLPLFDTWEFGGNTEHDSKRQNTQNARDDVLYEIESTNSMLIDTIISIIADNKTDGVIATGEGIMIKLSYTAVSLRPDLKSLFATSSKTPVIMPAKLLVPADYPKCSPVQVTDQKGQQLWNMFSDISDAVDTMFRNTLHGMPERRSIREMVEVWDTCVQWAIAEFAQRFGGGVFSHSYGRWESCSGA